MIDEISTLLEYDFGRFLLFGYSGGGHFAHRFLYIHPEKLLGVSVGAPGSVTLLDDSKAWWPGIQNFEQIFGKPLNYSALREVMVQLVVGKVDLETGRLPTGPAAATTCRMHDAGVTRIERNTALLNSLREHGIDAIQDIVPNVGHDGMKVLEQVKISSCGFCRHIAEEQTT